VQIYQFLYEQGLTSSAEMLAEERYAARRQRQRAPFNRCRRFIAVRMLTK
jgi:hypothetical protein